MRVVLATLSAAVATVGSSLVVLPLAADNSPDPLSTPNANTLSAVGSDGIGSYDLGSNGNDRAVSVDIGKYVSRAYRGCRIWSRNNWPRSDFIVADNGQQYRSHGDVYRQEPAVGYAYNVFSDAEIRDDGNLEEVEIIQMAPRAGAPVSESTFFLRYRVAANPADLQRFDLDGTQCR
jgi:hypothetical protein